MKKRTKIPGWRTKGKQVTLPVKILDAKGDPLDLAARTLTLQLKKPNGSAGTASITKRIPQVGADLGYADVVVSAANNDVASTGDRNWELDVYVDGEDLPLNHWEYEVWE